MLSSRRSERRPVRRTEVKEQNLQDPAEEAIFRPLIRERLLHFIVGHTVNTQSHAILTFYVIRKTLGKRAEGIRRLNVVLFSGALVPDLSIFLFFTWYTLVEPTPQKVIWGKLYFRSGWQMLFNAFHSFPIWICAWGIFRALKKPRAALFSLSALLASAEDFFLHHNDAHAHFFPFSDYRFISPVSYWNPAHYGVYASVAELILVTLASFWVFRRLETRWGKWVLCLSVGALYASHPLWMYLFSFF
jgi:hypothetical protein